MRSRVALLLLLLTAACGPRHPVKEIGPPSWIPVPQSAELTGGAVRVQRVAFRDPSMEPLVDVFVEEVRLVSGVTLEKAHEAGRRGDIVLGLDESLPEEAYWIDAGTQHRVSMNAGSLRGLAWATSTLLQATQSDENGLWVPRMHVRDQPQLPWRGLLVDVARQPHPVEVVEALVIMCRYYKIRYLQLHLTDDQAFMFPSAAYPQLASESAYTREELEALVDFAEVRGVTLIPEIDGPGHSTAMRKAMPELFGAEDLGVMDLTSEEMYAALDTLIGEVAEVFHTSPYIHIGADEAWLERLSQKLGDDADPYELFLDYIVRVDYIVRNHDKQTIVWESFKDRGSEKFPIPSDILVMAFETLYQTPDELLANGYTIVNTSWQPLYVTPWARWDEEEILKWNPFRWDHFLEQAPAFGTLTVGSTPGVVGGQMCSWENAPFHEVDALRPRLAAFASRAWRPSQESLYERRDARLMQLLLPARVTWDGLTDPDYVGSGPFRQTWFRTKIRVDVQSRYEVHCTTDGSVPTSDSPRCDETPLQVTDTTMLWLRAFDESGVPVGPGWFRRLEYQTLSAEISGAKPHGVRPWEGLCILGPETAAEVRLSANAEGTIRYTTDGTSPTSESLVYENPIVVNEPLTIRAQLFGADGQPLGRPWSHTFRAAP